MKRTITPGREYRIAAAVLLASLAAACSLDSNGKNRCEVQSDCLEDYVCLASQCIMPVGVPEPPLDVTALPGSNSVKLSWTPSDNATSYLVYSWVDPDLSTMNDKRTVLAPPVALPGGTGYPQWFRVAAVNKNGESRMSTTVCAVPLSSDTDTRGLTLYDPLCSGDLDSARWIGTGSRGGSYAIGSADGEAVATVSMRNQQPRSTDNAVYSAFATVNAFPGRRVTRMSSDVIVPSALASRTGSSAVIAALHLIYQPPAVRKTFPGANQDLLLAEIGLIDDGRGPRAYRQAAHCDDASSAAMSNTGVTFTEPAGWTVSGRRATTPAAYDTVYHLTVALDEDTGKFQFMISGGGFGPSGVLGTADPSSYLATSAVWSGVPLNGEGFVGAQMGVSTFDDSASGGGSGSITARFDNVDVGHNGGLQEPWDRFFSPGSSGLSELWVNLWSNGGLHVLDAAHGAVELRDEAMGGVPGLLAGGVLQLANPTAANTIQAEVAIWSFYGDPHLVVEGRFYNDGFAGTAAPDLSGPNSAVGDVLASVILQPASQTAQYLIVQCNTATCADRSDTIASGDLPGVTIDSGVHAIRLSWDPVARQFSFGVDQQVQVIDPTGAAPVRGPSNAPLRRIFTTTTAGDQMGGVRAGIRARVTNVFTAP
jgi:hypothetical protein